MAARKLPKSKLKRKRDTRPSAAKRGYNYAWQKSRSKRLKKSPKCVTCGNPAKHFHHQPSGKTVPKCTSCHNRMTARNKGKKKYPKVKPKHLRTRGKINRTKTKSRKRKR